MTIIVIRVDRRTSPTSSPSGCSMRSPSSCTTSSHTSTPQPPSVVASSTATSEASSCTSRAIVSSLSVSSYRKTHFYHFGGRRLLKVFRLIYQHYGNCLLLGLKRRRSTLECLPRGNSFFTCLDCVVIFRPCLAETPHCLGDSHVRMWL